jgi:hypothetical protein
MFENNLLEDIHLDECVSCGAGLLAVSDICPQCGWLKNKPIELDESEEKIVDDIELDESEEKVVDDIKNNPSTKEPTEIKNKIYRPTGIRLLGIFYMVFGISLVVFGIIFGSAVMYLAMISAIFSIDPSIVSFLNMIIELHGIVGSPSVNEIEARMSSTGVFDMDAIMQVITEASVIAIIEITLGIFAVIVGIGLLKGKKLARIVTIVSAVISIPLVVLFVENIDNLILLGIAAFDGMVLYYMFKSKVREYFNQNSTKKPNKKSKIKNSKTVKKS